MTANHLPFKSPEVATKFKQFSNIFLRVRSVSLALGNILFVKSVKRTLRTCPWYCLRNAEPFWPFEGLVWFHHVPKSSHDMNSTTSAVNQGEEHLLEFINCYSSASQNRRQPSVAHASGHNSECVFRDFVSLHSSQYSVQITLVSI